MCFIRRLPDGIGGTGDVVRLRLLVRGPGTWSPFLPSTFKVLFHTGGRLYLPALLLSVGLLIFICMDSLTPLSNHVSSTSSILTLSRVMLWSGWSQFMCLETSEFTELGLMKHAAVCEGLQGNAYIQRYQVLETS